MSILAWGGDTYCTLCESVCAFVRVGAFMYVWIGSFVCVCVCAYFRFLTNISRVTLNNSYDIWKSRNSLVN